MGADRMGLAGKVIHVPRSATACPCSARPVAYPDANSPQAWATGAVLLLVRALLGISVDTLQRRLVLHPIEIDGLSHLCMRDLRVGGAPVDIEVRFTDGAPRTSIRGLPGGWNVEGASVAGAG